MKRATMDNDKRVTIYGRCPKHPKAQLWVWKPSEIIIHGGECETCGGEPELCGVTIKSDPKTTSAMADAEDMLTIFEGMTMSVRDRNAIDRKVADAMIGRSRGIRARLKRA